MKINSRVLSLLVASFLIASPLIGLGQAGEQTVSSGTEVAVPDGTYIHAKLRKDFNAKKAQVGDSVELEVLEDVLSQPTTTVLIPKEARLLGTVLSVEPAAEKDGKIGVSIRVARAEWKGGFAKLHGVIIAVGAPPKGVTGSTVKEVGPSVPVKDEKGHIIGWRSSGAPGPWCTNCPRTDPSAPSVPPPAAPARLTAVAVDGKLLFNSSDRSLPSGTVFYLEHRQEGSKEPAQGTPDKYGQAFLPTLAAAQRGDAQAQFKCGVMYYAGAGVRQDHVEAAAWFTKAAEQGFAAAQNALGVMRARGQGATQDYVSAYMWFTVAAPAKPDKNEANLKALESLMTPEQIAEGKRRAEEWLKQHPPSH